MLNWRRETVIGYGSAWSTHATDGWKARVESTRSDATDPMAPCLAGTDLPWRGGTWISPTVWAALERHMPLFWLVFFCRLINRRLENLMVGHVAVFDGRCTIARHISKLRVENKRKTGRKNYGHGQRGPEGEGVLAGGGESLYRNGGGRCFRLERERAGVSVLYSI